MEGIECSGFVFYNAFDSANLAKVVLVPHSESAVTATGNPGKPVIEIPDVEFSIWTKPDCCGTEFENANRTWFYFGVKAPGPGLTVRLNLVDLNRQGKMYGQGMAPVYRMIPGKLQWERIRDKPSFNTTDDIFTVSFKFKTPENPQSVTYFAFTYPFSYVDLQKMLHSIDSKFLNSAPTSEDDIYYTNEVVCRSLEGRDVNLITISSYHGITTEKEVRLKNLFPENKTQRPFKFVDKKVIFVSARVHPGETPSSFVFNGFLNLLLTREDPVAIILRKLYVFKMIPFLNPDGVARGHYRTDSRGVNLNRVYLNPLQSLHPSVFAARALIRYYHHGEERDEVTKCKCNVTNLGMDLGDDGNTQNDSSISKKVSHMTLEEDQENIDSPRKCPNCGQPEEFDGGNNGNESGLFLYLDMHGHASKKGIFMYGNHFDDVENAVACMTFPKVMSINNHNFHFTACNFTERNMYLRDKRDGMSREGSGRVAVLKLTGLIRSYTLECNYNTGRLVNVLPATIKEPHSKVHTLSVPPKYNPQIFEEVGKSIGPSILDLTGHNPCTRLPNSEFHSLNGLRDWLRLNCAKEFEDAPIIPNAKLKVRNLSGLHAQAKSRGVVKTRPTVKTVCKKISKSRPTSVPIERKENVAFRASTAMGQPSCSHTDRSQRIKSGGVRLNKTLIGTRTKVKKELAHKLLHKVGASGDKPKGGLRANKGKVDQKVRPETKAKSVQAVADLVEEANEQERVKLREICFVKSNDVLITESGNSVQDDLLLSWKPSSSSSTPSLYSKKDNFISNKIKSEPGPSRQGPYLSHNFCKAASFPKTKFKKHSLRRLANPVEPSGKVEKIKKRKKLKTK